MLISFVRSPLAYKFSVYTNIMQSKNILKMAKRANLFLNKELPGLSED